jgi:hypothetical protein
MVKYILFDKQIACSVQNSTDYLPISGNIFSALPKKSGFIDKLITGRIFTKADQTRDYVVEPFLKEQVINFVTLETISIWMKFSELLP